MVASSSMDGTVKIWNPSTGICSLVFDKHTSTPFSLVWSPNGTMITSVDGTDIIMWNPLTGELYRDIPYRTGPASDYDFHTNAISSFISISPNGTWLAVGTVANTASVYRIFIYNLTTGQEFGHLWITGGAAYTVSFDDTGSNLAVGCDDNNIYVVELNATNIIIGDYQNDNTSDRATIKYTLTGHTAPVLSLDWSPDNTRIASTGRDGHVIIWNNLSNSSERTSIYPDTTVTNAFCVKWLDNTEVLFSTSTSNQPYQYFYAYAADGSGALFRANQSYPVYAFDTYGSQIITAGGDTNVNIWSTGGNYVRTMLAHKANYAIFVDYWVKWNDREAKFVKSSGDARIYVWNTVTSSWDLKELDEMGAKFASAELGEQLINEISIPRSRLNTEEFDMELFTAGQNVSHAQDSVPDDFHILDMNHNYVKAVDDYNEPDLEWSDAVTSLSNFARLKITYYTVSGIPSASGTYHFGYHPSPVIAKRMSGLGLLVTDSTTPGVYDKVYLDFNGDHVFDESDVNVTKNNPIAVYDKNGDGFPDFSAGMIYFISSSKEVSNELITVGDGGSNTTFSLDHDNLVAFPEPSVKLNGNKWLNQKLSETVTADPGASSIKLSRKFVIDSTLEADVVNMAVVNESSFKTKDGKVWYELKRTDSLGMDYTYSGYSLYAEIDASALPSVPTWLSDTPARTWVRLSSDNYTLYQNGSVRLNNPTVKWPFSYDPFYAYYPLPAGTKIYAFYNFTGPLVANEDYTFDGETGVITLKAPLQASLNDSAPTSVNAVYTYHPYVVDKEKGLIALSIPLNAGDSLEISYDYDGEFLPYSSVYAEEKGLTNLAAGNGNMVAFAGELMEGNSGSVTDHGTRVASAIASQTRNQWSNISGVAPGAKLICIMDGAKTSNVKDAWYFAANGYDGYPNTGDEANVVVNAFTYPTKTESGYDYYSRLADYVSMEYTSGKLVFVGSAGSGGYGYGTIPSPGGSPSMITMGGMLDISLYVESRSAQEGPYPATNEVDMMSGKGPTLLGNPKPELVTIEMGYVDVPPQSLTTNDGNESYTKKNQLWISADYSAAVGAGAVAILMQAYLQTHGSLPDVQSTREILMSSADDLGFDSLSQGSGNLNLTRAVYVAIDGRNQGNPDVTVDLHYGKETIGSMTLTNLTEEKLYRIDIPLSQTLTIPEGASIGVGISVSDAAAGLWGRDGYADIYCDYPSDSRIEMPTYTYVHVEAIRTYNSSSQTDAFQGGDDVYITATVSDPFGYEDIAGANITIIDPDNNVLISGTNMTPVNGNGALANFSYTFTLDNNSSAGSYIISVTGIESNGITHTAEGHFIIPTDRAVSVYPDYTIEASPGEVVPLSIFIQNSGNTTDVYDLTVSASTQGWRTELWNGSIEMAYDSDGNGVWDWVASTYDRNSNGAPDLSLAPRNHTELVLKKVIPNTAGNVSDTTEITATSVTVSTISSTSVATINCPITYLNKTLHIHQNSTLTTSSGSGPGIVRISNGKSREWTQTPRFATEFKVGHVVSIYLYISPASATGDGSTITTDEQTWVPGGYHGEHYDAFTNMMLPGSSSSTQITLSNHGQSDLTATVESSIYKKVNDFDYSEETDTYSYEGPLDGVTHTLMMNSTILVMNGTGLYTLDRNPADQEPDATTGLTGLQNYPMGKLVSGLNWTEWNASWNRADMVRVTAYADFDKYSATGSEGTIFNYSFSLSLQGWDMGPQRFLDQSKIDHSSDFLYPFVQYTNCTFPTENDFTAVVLNSSLSYPYVEETYPIYDINTISVSTGTANMPSNVLQVETSNPREKGHDGLVLFLNGDGTEDGIVWNYHIEFFNKTTWSWVSINGASDDSVNIPAGGSTNVTLAMNVPPDTHMGSYEGSIKITTPIPGANRTDVSTIPVVVNVGSDKGRVSFGGVVDEYLMNPTSFMGGYGLYEDEADRSGDWRYFYVDIPSTGIYSDPTGKSLVVDLKWDNMPTDLDVMLFEPSADSFSGGNADRYGPSSVKEDVASETPLTYEFNTRTGDTEEILATDLTTGLHIIAIRPVRMAGKTPFENITSLDLGIITHSTDLTVQTNNYYDTGNVFFSSTVPFSGLNASAVGPANSETETDIPIPQDYQSWWNFPTWPEWLVRGSYTKVVHVENALIFDVHIWGHSDAPDLDLGIFYDANGDGIAQPSEYVATCADWDADEEVKLTNPVDGDYIIKVLGFDTADPGHFDITISIILATGEGYKITGLDPAVPYTAGDVVTFGMVWNFPGNTEENEYMGAINVGPKNAPDLILIPVSVTLDVTPPAMEETKPGYNEVVNSERPTVLFSFSDANTIDTSSASMVIDGVDYTKNCKVTDTSIIYTPKDDLGEGMHIVNASISDVAGNVLTYSWMFTIDTSTSLGDPNTVIDVPVAGDDGFIYTDSSTYTFGGVVTAGTHFTVNGQPVEVATDGSFTITLNLTEGTNIVNLVASDDMGKTTTRELFIVYDTTAPTFTVTPSARLTRDSGIKLTGSIQLISETGPVTLSVNGRNIPVNTDGTFEYEVLLEEGQNVIDVTATDAAGNSATTELTVTRDTAAPPLNMDSVPEITSTKQLTVSGTAESGAKVYINGKQVITTAGSFSSQVALSVGTNLITVSAVDAAGNAAEYSFTVVYQPDTEISALTTSTAAQTAPALTSTAAMLIALAAIIFLIIGFIASRFIGGKKGGEDGGAAAVEPIAEVPVEEEVPEEEYEEYEEAETEPEEVAAPEEAEEPAEAEDISDEILEEAIVEEEPEPEVTEPVEEGPFDLGTAVEKGKELLAAGDTVAAMEVFDSVVENSPDEVDGYLGKARVFDATGKWGKALQMVNKALEVDPQSTEAMALKGDIFAGQGKNEMARSAYEQALEIEPGNTDIRNKLSKLD